MGERGDDVDDGDGGGAAVVREPRGDPPRGEAAAAAAGAHGHGHGRRRAAARGHARRVPAVCGAPNGRAAARRGGCGGGRVAPLRSARGGERGAVRLRARAARESSLVRLCLLAWEMGSVVGASVSASVEQMAACMLFWQTVLGFVELNARFVSRANFRVENFSWAVQCRVYLIENLRPKS